MSMGMEAGGKKVSVQRGINTEELEKAIAKLMCGKAAGVDAMIP